MAPAKSRPPEVSVRVLLPSCSDCDAPEVVIFSELVVQEPAGVTTPLAPLVPLSCELFVSVPDGVAAARMVV